LVPLSTPGDAALDGLLCPKDFVICPLLALNWSQQGSNAVAITAVTQARVDPQRTTMVRAVILLVALVLPPVNFTPSCEIHPLHRLAVPAPLGSPRPIVKLRSVLQVKAMRAALVIGTLKAGVLGANLSGLAARPRGATAPAAAK
jgi:hypothetical protein